MAVDQLLHPYAGAAIDKVVGLEARGFILGGAIAHQLSLGFVPIRKKGKLPGRDDQPEIQAGIRRGRWSRSTTTRSPPGERVLLVDDLLATGGTAEAGIQLVERLGGADRRLRLHHRPARARRPASAEGEA